MKLYIRLAKERIKPFHLLLILYLLAFLIILIFQLYLG